jgi:hypothetical protein
MFNSIIIALSLTIIWTENATVTCGVPCIGCYKYWNKEIVLQYQVPRLNSVFYHEMAHAMFEKDFGVYNEEIPRSFEEYMDDKSYFKNRYPELYWVFENKLKQYENN